MSQLVSLFTSSPERTVETISAATLAIKAIDRRPFVGEFKVWQGRLLKVNN